MQFAQIAIEILRVIGTIITVLYLHKAVFFVVGFFKVKRFKPTEHKHFYGICVAARNEEKVIGNFLESVANQDYPLDKLTVFVMAHNCTDGTAEVVKKLQNVGGIKIVLYEHNCPTERTKGYALKRLFEMIGDDYGIDCFDGYFVFDADNVIAKNYVTKMNEAFDEGNKIVTSFRNSKNVNRNWISFGYAMHWLRTCLTENRAKGYLNQACRVQGTGFLFSNELVKDGWKYTTLTEDRSFCTDAVVQGYRISYCEEAVFYDEQPYSLKVALRQRVRWAKGHLQSTVENCPKLLKNIFKRNGNFWITYDSFFLNFPRSVESGVRKILKYILQIYIAIATASVYGWAIGLISGYFSGKVSSWAGAILVELAVFIKYGKHIEGESAIKRLWHIFMFPFFDIIGKWSTYVALFKKVEWKAIPHDTVVDVEKLGGKREK